MKYPPVKVAPISSAHRAAIGVFGPQVHIANWTIDLGGRPGDLNDNKDEVMLAILGYVTAQIHARVSDRSLLPIDDETARPTPAQLFESEHLANIVITQAAAR